MAIYMWREEEAPTFTGLYFTSEEANSTVALNKIGTPTEVELEISTDGVAWIDYTIGNTITLANVGDKVYMRNKSETTTGFSTSLSDYYQFSMTGSIAGSGDVNCLINKNSTDTVSSLCYNNMFNGCASLTTAPELPATTLASGCYNSMFDGCTSLTIAPELPATTLAPYCYTYMFTGCTSLTKTPELPATTLAPYCYYGMFMNCTSLTQPAILQATTLADYCCAYMFYGCTDITTPHELPATTLAESCYYSMFHGCTGIKLSETETSEYNIPYRIPSVGEGTTALDALFDMFTDTGGTFTGTPTINTTYYLSNGTPAYPTESIVVKIRTDNSGNLRLPRGGLQTSGSVGAPYNWNISVNGGAPTTFTGTGATNAFTVASGLDTSVLHTVVITPVVEEYGWARAFGFYDSGLGNKEMEIVYDGSYMGYAVSATDTGAYFRARQYQGMNIKNAPAEVLPDTVTTIGNNFRYNQYYNSLIESASVEVLPNSVTSIGNYFRFNQYNGCARLTTAPDEVMSNSVTSIGIYFRNFQYGDCTGLTITPVEVMPNLVTNIGTGFRYGQFDGCVGLTIVSGVQATPTSLAKGENFRNGQFTRAGNTTTPMTVTINGNNIETGASNSLSLTNANVEHVYVDSSLVTTYQGSADWSNIDDVKFGPIPAPTLLSYEEIKAMAQSSAAGVINTLNELNSQKSDYYNKFNSENHLFVEQLSDNGTMAGLLYTFNGGVIAYDNGEWVEGA